MEVTQRIFQRQFITVRAQTGHDPDRKVGQIRVMTERFACVDIGKMHFDKRDGHRCQRVADRHAGVGVSRRIDDDEIHVIAAGLVDTFDQRTFMVVLKSFDKRTDSIPTAGQCTINVVQRGEPVMRGFAATQQIQVGTVHNQDMRMQTGGRFSRYAAGSFSRHGGEFAVDGG